LRKAKDKKSLRKGGEKGGTRRGFRTKKFKVYRRNQALSVKRKWQGREKFHQVKKCGRNQKGNRGAGNKKKKKPEGSATLGYP